MKQEYTILTSIIELDRYLHRIPGLVVDKIDTVPNEDNSEAVIKLTYHWVEEED